MSHNDTSFCHYSQESVSTLGSNLAAAAAVIIPDGSDGSAPENPYDWAALSRLIPHSWGKIISNTQHHPRLYINKSESLFICKTELWEQILVNLQTTFITQSISLTSEVCIEVCCSPPGARVAVLVVLVLVGAPLQVPEPLHGLHPLSVVWVTKTHFNYLVLRPHHLTWVQVIHLCAPVVLALPVKRPVAVLPLPPLGHHVSLDVGGLQHIALI